jgi:hypothetical protein
MHRNHSALVVVDFEPSCGRKAVQQVLQVCYIVGVRTHQQKGVVRILYNRARQTGFGGVVHSPRLLDKLLQNVGD